VIWYQGESNAHNVELYEHQLPALIGSWRSTWNNDEMPFHIVQLSSINRDTWPHFRDTQRRLALAIENCEMAVSSDKGHPTDVHPRDKEPIGQRLARLALHYDYGFSHVVPSGPVVKSVKCVGNEVIVEFDNAHGLATSDDAALRTFELADKWGVFHSADVAVIDGEKVRLSSSKVAVPKFVRYGWQPFTTANLVNGEGLPASTFKAVVD
jgi:sialate O-acetylesterase